MENTGPRSHLELLLHLCQLLENNLLLSLLGVRHGVYVRDLLGRGAELVLQSLVLVLDSAQLQPEPGVLCLSLLPQLGKTQLVTIWSRTR